MTSNILPISNAKPRQQLWSPEPPEAYTVTIEGHSIGFGSDQRLQLRSMWNLCWLFSDLMDKGLNRQGDNINEIPADSDIIPYVELDHEASIGGYKLSNVALLSQPQDLVVLLAANKREAEQLALSAYFGGYQHMLKVAARRADIYITRPRSESKAEIIVGKFGGR